MGHAWFASQGTLLGLLLSGRGVSALRRVNVLCLVAICSRHSRWRAISPSALFPNHLSLISTVSFTAIDRPCVVSASIDSTEIIHEVELDMPAPWNVEVLLFYPDARTVAMQKLSTLILGTKMKSLSN